MNIKVALLVGTLFMMGCQSQVSVNTLSNATTENSSSNIIAKSNVNPGSNTPYSLSENAYTRGSTSPLKALRPFIGKTVNEAKLWQNAEFSSRLGKLMGDDYEVMKKFWNTETPIEKFGDFLMMTGCEQQNRGGNQYIIFVDTAVGRIQVIHIVNGTSKEWNGGGEMSLPPIFADELAKIKSHS